MTHAEAEALAQKVNAATGHVSRVEFEDEKSGFVVLVPIAQPRSRALREEFRIADELDWHHLRDRIASS